MFSQLLTTVIIFCLYQTYKGCLTMFDYGESTTGLGEVSIMIIVFPLLLGRAKNFFNF